MKRVIHNLAHVADVDYYAIVPLTKNPSRMNALPPPVPASEKEALQWLLSCLDKPARKLEARTLKQAWSAIFYLYGGLHPDGAIDHGAELITTSDAEEKYAGIEPRLIAPRYEASGWPVALAPLATEAWRRYEAGMLREDEFYASAAQRAGFMERMED